MSLVDEARRVAEQYALDPSDPDLARACAELMPRIVPALAAADALVNPPDAGTGWSGGEPEVVLIDAARYRALIAALRGEGVMA